MKEKIFKALKDAILVGGKTSVSDATITLYLGLIDVEKITEESQIAEAIKPIVPILQGTQANINSVAKGAVETKESELKTAHQKEIEDLKKSNPNPKEDDLEAKLNALLDAKVKPLQDKLSGYETKEAKAVRQAMITSKAKELKISQGRIDEGFVISDDADETAIGEYLSKVRQNEVSKGLESRNEGMFAYQHRKLKEKSLPKIGLPNSLMRNKKTNKMGVTFDKQKTRVDSQSFGVVNSRYCRVGSN